jgi:2-amino-4-hydroxy-6-hydroxymethyldihydropteridine diphosphokinase
VVDGVQACVALGSNLADPRAQVERGFEALAHLPHTVLEARSRLYCTQPWGVLEQPDFVNAAVRVRTRLTPRALLEQLLAIEVGAGRVRGVPNGPRTLDLDLLVYGTVTCIEPDLVLPHPRLHERAFVLLPLADVAPELEVPGRGRVRELLERVDTTGCLALA